MSPPVKIAYSKPECLARPLAKRVLPVPGGPALVLFSEAGGGRGGGGEGCRIRGMWNYYQLPYSPGIIPPPCKILF